MKVLFLISLLFISVFGLGQEPVVDWQRSYGGSHNEYANSIQQTTDGGYILAGRSRSNDGDVTVNNGIYDYWVLKLDLAGNVVWEKSLGGSSDDEAKSVQQTTDGGYILAGYTESNNGDVTGNNGLSDYWVIKLDSDGSLSWQKTLGGSSDDVAESIQQTADGGYIVVGYSQSDDGDLTTNNGSYDYWIVKLDASGNISWDQSLGGSSSDQAYSIRQTDDDGFIVAGSSSSNDGNVSLNNGSNDYWIVKLDIFGSIIWEKSIGGFGNDIANSIQQSIDGGYIVAGYSGSNNGDVSGNNGQYDYWVVKLNSSGIITWEHSLGGSGDDRAESVQQTMDGGYIILGFTDSNDGDILNANGDWDFWIVKLDSSGNIDWRKALGGSGREWGNSVIQIADGNFVLAGWTHSFDGYVTENYGGRDYWVVKLDNSNINGRVFHDFNESCIQDLSELGVSGISVQVNPGGLIADISSNGLWRFDSLPAGTYTVTIDTTNLNWTPTCSVSQTFTVTDPQVYTPGPDFGIISNNPCTSPDISIHAPFLRRCFSDQGIYVQACNDITATGALNAAYADIELDSLLTPTSSSIAYSSLGNDVYRFQLGNINPGQCVDFTINTTVSCDAVLDQTLCMDAKLYPVDSCALDSIPTDPLPPNYGNDPNLVMPQPCTLPWDKSSLQVEGWCQGDSVQFSITNTGDLGDGDMDCYSPVLLYVNDTLVNIDSVQLLGQETIYFSYPANGETWILAAEQHPLHPGNSHPNAHVELCGSDSTQWIPDMINNQPLDDADPVDDIYCGIVTGSYDPNDKRGFPTGVTSQHHVQPNQHLQYVIRFQNTGTDTAFTVVIRDTLDTDLNIFTVNSGVSSHDYTFRTYGPRVLEWTFDEIMLPDSTTDEPGSNGFVTFTVDQVPDLPNGTVINNQADIYFDFNAPIITNETDHLIDDTIEGDAIGDFVVQTESACSSYTWNTTGQTYTQSGIYTEVLTNNSGLDSTVTLSLTINENVVNESISSCENYTWNANGQTYTQSGQYTEVLTNQYGCDSTINLDLVINQTASSSETITSCDSYTWSASNQTYSQSGNYTAVLSSIFGCDSTVTLELTIDTVNTSIAQLNDNTLGAVTSNAQYQWVDCDQNYQAIAGATDQTFEATENGTYAAIIIQNGCTDTTDCITISNVGLNNEGYQIINLYPNPTSNAFTITADKVINTSFKIVDAQGKEVLSGKMNGKEQSIDISSFSKGTYSIVFEDSKLPVLSVIKE